MKEEKLSLYEDEKIITIITHVRTPSEPQQIQNLINKLTDGFDVLDETWEGEKIFLTLE